MQLIVSEPLYGEFRYIGLPYYDGTGLSQFFYWYLVVPAHAVLIELTAPCRGYVAHDKIILDKNRQPIDPTPGLFRRKTCRAGPRIGHRFVAQANDSVERRVQVSNSVQKLLKYADGCDSAIAELLGQ
jgi:hypothetical protein